MKTAPEMPASDIGARSEIDVTVEMIEAGATVLGRNAIWLERSSEEFDRKVIKEILEASLGAFGYRLSYRPYRREIHESTALVWLVDRSSLRLESEIVET